MTVIMQKIEDAYQVHGFPFKFKKLYHRDTSLCKYLKYFNRRNGEIAFSG